jgi:hypothetical protein
VDLPALLMISSLCFFFNRSHAAWSDAQRQKLWIALR